ncbi:class I poly(R)-hydroxyalkanoic acid synthase [Rhodobacteraceae bacterium RKSG542]|uniref:PHA/PHB synthase family protein n=1 Tax=Pseudovibrio flavus TaxID=2529854 RepID=UPI0012BD59CB|nr:class I poly(R)-hydroxyalkanoic acid synthase [Pseudovibrio flavus]MTI17335.1 class I poly(R)-hydroxyalkanoic acid synthase [Pseudovibrio flavus]
MAGDSKNPMLQYILDNPEEFSKNLARVFENGGKALSAYLEPREKGQRGPEGSEHLTTVVKTLSEVGEYWMKDPARAMEAQTRLWQGYMGIWNNTLKRMGGEEEPPIVTPDDADKRFKDPEWTDNNFFDFLKQMYLETANWAEDMVNEAEDIDAHTRMKAEFFVKQITNALSPSNFVLTNPELLRETMSSNAENLVRGMKHLAEDIEEGHGELKIRQTRTQDFEVGGNLATTPGKVIMQNDVCQLIQYEPVTTKVFKRPLLVVPPWINKYYILDLNPQKSFIKWAVEQGHTVFVISWINPDESQAAKSWDHYMQEGILQSIEQIKKTTAQSTINAVGYCVGGTLLAITLAYLEKTGQADRIASATFLTTQVDFEHAGDLLVFVDDEQVTNLEEAMNRRGYLEGGKMAAAFNMLRPNDLIWTYVVNNYLKGKEPFPFDLLYWNSDSTRMTAANQSFYLRNLYLNNMFSKGELEIAGIKVSPTDIKIPVYTLATKEDHIAPARSVLKGASLFSGPVEFVLSGSGHIAGVVNPPEKNKYQYWTAPQILEDLDEWLSAADETTGSWWPHWDKWIKNLNSDVQNARKLGARRTKLLEDAPGSYVKVKA